MNSNGRFLLSALLLAPIPSGASDTLSLGPAPTLEQPLFVEIYRQAVFVRAAHNCGLSTIDASVRSPTTDAIYEVTLARRQGLLTLSLREKGRPIRAIDATYPTGLWEMRDEIERAHAEASRLLEPICSATKRTEKNDSPISIAGFESGPDDAYALMRRINRLTHNRAPLSAGSLRALALSYCLLGKKLEFLSGPYPKTLFARALAYAEEMKVRAGNRSSPTLATVLIAAGRPADGVSQLANYRGTADRTLADLASAWADRDGKRAASAPSSDIAPLKAYIQGWILMGQKGETEFWRARLKQNRMTFEGYHYILVHREVVAEHEFTTKYLATVLGWPPFLRAVAGNAPEAKTKQQPTGSANPKRFLDDLLRLSSTDSDEEIPGAFRVVVARDLAFDATFRRIRFLAQDFSHKGVAALAAEELAPIIWNHPWGVLIPVTPPLDSHATPVQSTPPDKGFASNGVPASLHRQLSERVPSLDIVADRVAPPDDYSFSSTGAKVYVASTPPNPAPPQVVAAVVQDHQLTWGVMRMIDDAWDLQSMPSIRPAMLRRHDNVRLDLTTLLVATQNDAKTASNLAKELIAIDPRDPITYSYLASDVQGDPTLLLRALRAYPDDIQLLSLAAKYAIYGSTEARSQASGVIDHLWQLDPGNPDALIAIYNRLVLDGKLREAEQILGVGLQREKGTLMAAGYLSSLADLYLMMGRPQDALALSAAGARSGSANTLMNLSLLLERLGRLNEAGAIYDDIQRRYGDTNGVDWIKTMFFARTGRKDVTAILQKTAADFTPYLAAGLHSDELAPELVSAVIVGDWSRMDTSIQRVAKEVPHPEPSLLVWWTICRLKQGLPLSQAIAPVREVARKASADALGSPLLSLFVGRTTPERVMEDIPRTISAHAIAEYFVSSWENAVGHPERAEKRLRRCSETATELSLYTLAQIALRPPVAPGATSVGPGKKP